MEELEGLEELGELEELEEEVGGGRATDGWLPRLAPAPSFPKQPPPCTAAPTSQRAAFAQDEQLLALLLHKPAAAESNGYSTNDY